MPDTKRTLSALQTLLESGFEGNISAQDIRDFLVSVFDDVGYGSGNAVTAAQLKILVNGIVSGIEVIPHIVNLRSNAMPSSYYHGNGADQYWKIPRDANLEMGINDFSFLRKVKLPDYTPLVAVTIAYMANTTDNLGWIFTLETDGKLQLAIGNGSDFTTYVYKSTVAIRCTNGNDGYIAFTADRDGNISFYSNGILDSIVDMSGSSSQTVTCTTSTDLYAWQNINGSTEYEFIDYDAKMANMLFTAAEIVEYMNGSVNFKHQGASQTELVTDGDMSNAGSWNATAGWDINSTVVGKAYYDNLTTGARIDQSFIMTKGKYCKLKLTFTNVNTNADLAILANSGAIPIFSGADILASGATLVSENKYTYVNGTYVIKGICLADVTNFRLYAYTSSGGSFELDDVSIITIGIVAENDESGKGHKQWAGKQNNLHIEIIGATLHNEDPVHIEKYVKTGIANTATALIDIHSAGYKLIAIRAKGSAALTAIKIGTSSGGEQIVASVSVGTSPIILTLVSTANDGYSESAADTIYAEHATAGETLDLTFIFQKVGL